MTARIALFDLGGVVLDWSPARLYEKLIPDATEREHFLTNICSMAWHTRHDAGVSFADNARELIAKNPKYEIHIRAWSLRWMDMFNGYIDGTARLIDHLSGAGVPLFALSNVPDEPFAAMLEAFPVLQRFDDVVVSGRIGMVKPGSEIFRHTLIRMGDPDPAEVLFIDDVGRNVQTANAMNFRTHLFVNAGRLERDLTLQGLL